MQITTTKCDGCKRLIDKSERAYRYPMVDMEEYDCGGGT